MTDPIENDLDRWGDACIAGILLAMDPKGLGGACLTSLPGPGLDAWLGFLRTRLPANAPWRKIPSQIDDDRLLGGLDLSATLRLGKPVIQRGVLAESNGGVVLQTMAERLPVERAARMVAAIDQEGVTLARDGLSEFIPTRFITLLLNEALSPEEAPPTALLDRLAFNMDLSTIRPDLDIADLMPDQAEIEAAQGFLVTVEVDDAILASLCAAAVALGIASLRAPLMAVKAARCLAALDRRVHVTQEDAATAARLILAPRATRLPDIEEPDPENPPEPDPPEENAEQPEDKPQPQNTEEELTDLMVEAAKAALPPGLLAALLDAAQTGRQPMAGGKSGSLIKSRMRGRPIGTRPGDLRSGQRLNVLQTLRTAAPWQRVRARERLSADKHLDDTLERPGRVDIRKEDFRITQFKERSETTTVFVVDASGSSAVNRLGEAKGAVELLLADCYTRRDSVALITFGGQKVDLALPPTRSLVRAKRLLAGLPGGGGTPIASAFDTASELLDSLRRKGQTPVLVVLTDGRANIARDGSTIRTQAEEDAKQAAAQIGNHDVQSLFIDISPRARPFAVELAKTMRAQYLKLPHADARKVSQAVQSALGV